MTPISSLLINRENPALPCRAGWNGPNPVRGNGSEDPVGFANEWLRLAVRSTIEERGVETAMAQISKERFIASPGTNVYE
jgi:hypothetical protein